MPQLVLDASVAVSAVLEEEQSDLAHAVLLQVAAQGGVVPNLWHLEVGQTLLVAERRRRIDAASRHAVLGELAALPIVVDLGTARQAWRDTTTLAERHGLTLYDAAYLELSLRLGLPLASFDDALRRAATTEGVTLL
ncbi:MAG: type II toxin-antitoxin system VapC family toxin [Acetobacteraceae bacterium]|nr:type II toxin-antitoxin system VapC family toxin [Acetobacteraceae bacterium]